MNKVVPNQGDKAPVSGRTIPRFPLLLTLLLTLLAVAGCRPGSNQPTATASEQSTPAVAAESTQRAATTDSVAALGQPASQKPPSQ